ncbi:hypothetical protein [Massilia sp.]|uniref:hypothetical protein n=1 Tax=Massilia sp. TaxID=1882437 RepID=UPI0028AEB94D|nr:hypothetical protein [Massilia sp.]
MARTIRCDNAECEVALPRLALAFCPFCGSAQTRRAEAAEAAEASAQAPAVTVATGAPASAAAGASAQPAPPAAMHPGADTDAARAFEAHLAAELGDPYCSAGQFQALVAYAGRQWRIPRARAETLLAMWLEQHHAVNEKQLLAELDGLLHAFTHDDRKLDKKERQDALQSICTPRPGYARGLDSVEAERYLIEFCRINSVRVRVGLFKWQVP